MPHKYFRQNNGFTLVELITVMVLLGVLAVVGSAKFFGQSSFSDTRYHQEVLSAFRYAQKIAIASQCDVVITLGANSYALTYSGSASCTGNVKHPSGQGNYSDSGTSDISPVSTYTFDASGGGSPSGSFTVGGRTITVEAVTGYVHDYEAKVLFTGCYAG